MFIKEQGFTNRNETEAAKNKRVCIVSTFICPTVLINNDVGRNYFYLHSETPIYCFIAQFLST